MLDSPQRHLELIINENNNIDENQPEILETMKNILSMVEEKQTKILEDININKIVKNKITKPTTKENTSEDNEKDETVNVTIHPPSNTNNMKRLGTIRYPMKPRVKELQKEIRLPKETFVDGINVKRSSFQTNEDLINTLKIIHKKYENEKSAVIDHRGYFRFNAKKTSFHTVEEDLSSIYHNNNDIYSIEEFSISQKRILSLAEKTNGNILCGTENDGLFEINYKSRNIKSYKHLFVVFFIKKFLINLIQD